MIGILTPLPAGKLHTQLPLSSICCQFTISFMKNIFPDNLLWVDCTAGAIVGVLVLALHSLLSPWYALPENILIFTGVANLLYASYSFSLAMKKQRKSRWILLLIIANCAWSPVCIYLAVTHWTTANFLGLGHLLLEAVFVGGLGYIEWLYRDRLIR